MNSKARMRKKNQKKKKTIKLSLDLIPSLKRKMKKQPNIKDQDLEETHEILQSRKFQLEDQLLKSYMPLPKQNSSRKRFKSTKSIYRKVLKEQLQISIMMNP